MTKLSQRQLCGVTFLLASVAVQGLASHAFAHATGVTTAEFSSPALGCNSCHFGGTTPTVQLTGSPLVLPGTTNVYTLTIDNPASQPKGGLNVSAPSGIFSTGGPDSANTKTLIHPVTGRLELTHSSPKTAVSDVTTFTFQWTAPSSFTSVTLTGWGNAVDGTGANADDQGAMSTLVISAESTPTPSPTPSPTPLMHDAVVVPVKPVKLTVPVGKTVTKKLRVKVRNADPTGETPSAIQLAVNSDCPPGVIVGTPDFIPSTPLVADDTKTVNAGRTASATVPITVHPMDFANQNHKAPSRCTLTFIATSPVPGNTEPTLPNNTVTAELNVIDKNVPEMATNDESLINSLPPLTVRIAKNVSAVLKKVKPKVTNADIIPAPELASDAIQVTVDVSSCAGIAVAALDMDAMTTGVQDTVLVKGGSSKTGSVQLSVTAGSIATTRKLSPTRCTAVISAAIAGNTEPDNTNNTARLVIDVIDANDF